MAKVVIYKDETGKLAGLGEANARAYNKFRAAIAKLEVGETLAFEWKAPRSPGFHRRHFALLNYIYEAQEQFQDADAFRMWVQVGAGFCDLLPGPKGKPVAVPRSIAWATLDEVDFSEHHAKVVAFLRSRHAIRFLWPHLDDARADEMMDSLLHEFD